jgi:hypothetical protein
MIRAWEFCREPHFPLTLFFSYSFDPLFFERIPLTDLDKGGNRRILVLADGSQIRDAMRACVGQLAYLGRRYVLAETVRPNTFHPKLIIRLSSTKGRAFGKLNPSRLGREPRNRRRLEHRASSIR